MSYIPQAGAQMTTPMMLLVPGTVEKVLGVNTKTAWQDSIVFMCNFKTYGGTERVVDGVMEIEDTAEIVTRFYPYIKADCRVKRLTDNAVFEIINDPENIEQRFQWLKFRIRRIKGGV